MTLPQPFSKKFHYAGAFIVFQIDLPYRTLFIHRNGVILKRLGAVEFPMDTPSQENEIVFQELKNEYNTVYIREVKKVLCRFVPLDLARHVSEYVRA